MEPEESPILFSGSMIPPIQLDIKTQTRRFLKLPPWIEDVDRAVFKLNEQAKEGKTPGIALYEDGRPQRRFVCPHGGAGRRLWVRETWRPVMEGWRSFVEYAAGGPELEVANRQLLTKISKVALRFPDARQDRHSEAWHPSIHMPRWASRIALEVTGIRIERLQSISEGDARAEGVAIDRGHCFVTAGHEDWAHRTARGCFESLWGAINGPESWDANPWVWVVSFKRLELSHGV